MPAPERASLTDITAAARAIAERDGLDAVTMSTVATAVGIRPPSLYKRVEDRRELLQLAIGSAATDLARQLAAAATSTTNPETALSAIAAEFRSFAARNPALTAALFTAQANEAAEVGPLGDALSSVMAVTSQLAPEAPLEAARLFTAWAYGFAVMEQAGAFRAGGDVDAAWHWALERTLDAVASTSLRA